MARARLYSDGPVERITISVSSKQKRAYAEFQKEHPGEFSHIMRSVLDTIISAYGIADKKSASLAVLDAEMEAITQETAKQLATIEERKRALLQTVNPEVAENRKLLTDRIRRRPEFFAENGFRLFHAWAVPGWSKELESCGFDDLKSAWMWFRDSLQSEGAI